MFVKEIFLKKLKTYIMKKKLIIPLALLTASMVSSAKAQDGQAIFTTKCTVCHTIGNGRLVGPDLKGVNTKYNIKYFEKWIKSSQSVINSDDAKAKALFVEYNSIIMPDFPDLKPIDIKGIVDYIKSQSGTQQVAAAQQPKKQAKPQSNIKKP